VRRPAKVILSGVLLLALALTGCGGSSSKPPVTVTVPFRSPALVNLSLPARYTCAGKDISPPLEWGAVPASIRSLALFVIGTVPNPRTGGYKISVEWAVAGINAALHKAPAGRLPAGAYAGRAASGKSRYSICPKKGTEQNYEFALYGVPKTIGIGPKFEGLELLQALASPNSAYNSHVGGSFVASVKRKAKAS
jgi:phosphatidylethanolamine-binding protein (PEBP) family uncharacterized protein